MLRIGMAKEDITVYKEHCGMLGYGRHFHYLRGIETRQYARAYVFEQNGKKLAWLSVEFCFCTENLKHGILEKLRLEQPHLGYHNANLMITGQHTHSAAGGYDQHFIYSITTPGFQTDVYEAYRDGLVRTILAAEADLKPRQMRWETGEFDQEAEVCFNRSIEAYNQNPEVKAKGKISAKKRHLACDRSMKMLRIEDEQGQVQGSINWFGVHTTSVSNRYDKVCYDNKGYAAEAMEKHYGQGVHAFAEDACGDVSPNFKWSRKYKIYRGPFEDDYENAGYNAKIQQNLALELCEKAQEGQRIEGDLDGILAYFDMTDVHLKPDYVGGLEQEYTSHACFGMAFLEGTTDGRGAPRALGAVLDMLFHSGKQVEILAAKLSKNPRRKEAVLRFHNAQHPKTVVMNLSKGGVMATDKIEKLALPDFVDPTIKYLKHAHRSQSIQTPWVPERMPLQIFIIGNLALIGIPAEITTIAGERLRNTLRPILAQRGVEHIQLCPYANSYGGYITTYEEYRTQSYEGGHTLYGKWTLAAYQQCFSQVAEELLKAPEERQALGVEPLVFPIEEIWKGFDNPKIRVY